MPTKIRLCTPDDLPVLQDIERAAGEAFRALGMDAIADDAPPSLPVLTGYQRSGRAWTATTPADHPVAYLLADIVDGAAHIEQVTVHPSHARRSIGRSLIDHLAHWSRTQGLTALTLTTFPHVPWNAPYYERCGFRVLGETEWTEGLREVRRREAEAGLERWGRVCMRREVLRGEV
ncbi:GNAT family N-acetyltransferase [Streptomyces gamaensis]|uniref:GNAT family N-acetyltransferase n=1 Tax=Streptomyces gamaensis TaxID=1763542 RepID=A0ABW0Z0D4_9ACTN